MHRTSRRRALGLPLHTALAPGLVVVVVLALAVLVATTHAGTSSSGAEAMGVRTTAHAAVNPDVAAGALDYFTFGCATCHGLYGRGGIKVPNISGSATIPALNTRSIREELSAETLRSIIQHGMVLKSTVARVYMPVWGAVLSDKQIADLVLYIKSGMPPISGLSPQPVRTDLGPVVEGQQLYVSHGCVVCHAFNGFGGVPNPSSPDKSVPPLRGAAFNAQFKNDSDIAYVIKHGSIIGQAPIVSMPVWSGLLTDKQISAIIAYIRSFR